MKTLTIERDYRINKVGRKFVVTFELDGNVVELRNLKVYEELSEETNCFTADVYFNGTFAGNARNDGRGGCATVHCTLEMRQWAVEALKDYHSDTFPTLKTSIFDIADQLAYYQWCADDYTRVKDIIAWHSNEIKHLELLKAKYA